MPTCQSQTSRVTLTGRFLEEALGTLRVRSNGRLLGREPDSWVLVRVWGDDRTPFVGPLTMRVGLPQVLQSAA